MTALAAQMEAITKKLDTLTQSVLMVQHPALVCAGCGADHITSSYPLASTHKGQSAEHPNYSWVDNPDQVNQMKDNPPVIQQQQENQVGQITAALANRPLGTLPNDTEKNPREQVLAVEAVNYATIELPSTSSTTPVKAYVPPIPFHQRLQRQPTTEQVQAITTRSEAIEKDQQIVSDNPQLKATVPGTSLTPLVPFPQTLQKTKLEKQAIKFLEILKKLHVNIPFIDAILQIPNYSKFLKEMLTKKRKMPEHETITLSEECSAIIQHRIPPKLKDPGDFALPCSIGNLQGINCLIDSGASINLIPLPLYRKLGLGDSKAASIILQLADRILKHPYGIVEDMLIKTGEFIFPADFIILDIEEASQISIILGRPFLSTSRALLDFDTNEIVLRVEDKQQSFTIENPIKQPSYFEDCQRVDHWESYKGQLDVGGIVSRDNNGNLIMWRMKDERKKCNQCLKCRAENSLFKPP
ncbi:uncharacterized protein LOC111411123 [Olea europaea var. sylvestris]|uniref:uncharacterized protein LOC111411123 n=1 Tax=Olea europaea var. sylvestris TaxID=158386 RepID=UPI000C1D6AE2|nr:uncharacterized protein LOC111411123 [Olea europaea var. sylvestris]